MPSLGTFTKGSATTTFKPTDADECFTFTVTATGQIASTGTIAVINTAGTVATDAFLNIESGAAWWGGMPNPTALVQPFFDDLVAAGHKIVLIRFNGSWYVQPASANKGWVTCACRPSTVFQWIKDNYPATTFNLIGSSNGSAAVAYALSQYGVTSDIAIIDSGPPEMEIKKGCEDVSGYGYGSNKSIIDKGYGYSSGGPCALVDTGFESNWDADSIEQAAGGVFLYPTIDTHVIMGGSDADLIRNRAIDYKNLLIAAGQTCPIYDIFAMGHGAFSSALAMNTIFSILSPSLGKIISLSGTGLSFGAVVVGNTSTGTLHVANTGDTTITVTSVSYPTAFTGDTSGFSVTPGSTHDITVSFTPAAVTSYSGNITVNSDATVPAATIAVSGSGLIGGGSGSPHTKKGILGRGL